MSLEAFEERAYQNELALPAQRGQNCIIIAPSGSGKTIVTVKIIKVLAYIFSNLFESFSDNACLDFLFLKLKINF